MRFYKPDNGWAADVIPFFWEGRFHFFYLCDARDDTQTGTPWEHVATEDFVSYDEYPQAIARGEDDDQDRWAYTGSVIQHDGRFYIYYTGHNSSFAGTARPQEVILRASSDDLVTWTKDPAFALAADLDRYEADDWRDPFVFWNEDDRVFWMLITARLRGRPNRRSGCLALATSPDLDNWTMREPLWEPGLFNTHECADLFRMGDWWYLIFSEYSDRTVTRYRMSRSLAGPWLAPPDDAVDTRAFYAAKTVSDGDRRYLCGWNPTRAGETDTGKWQWGGNIVVHQVAQAPDGTLRFRAPDAVRSLFASRPVALSVDPVAGNWEWQDLTLQATAGDGRAACLLGDLPSSCLIELGIDCSPGTQSCSVLLRTDEHADVGYELRWEVERSRLVIDRWPRPGDVPWEAERPLSSLAVPNGTVLTLTIFIDESVLVVYAGDGVALSFRLYDHAAGKLGLACAGGTARFARLEVKTPD
jgi:beta-fructofuranosidase